MTEAVSSPAEPNKPSAPVALIESAFGLLENIPYAILALPLRVAAATVFWRSGNGKLANWDTTIYLFEEEYNVPLLSPEFAAQMATTIELTAPVLLVVGLATRVSAGVLFGMTAVIQIFVYSMSWPTHIQWAAILLVILARGPGMISIDHLVKTKLAPMLGFKNI